MGLGKISAPRLSNSERVRAQSQATCTIRAICANARDRSAQIRVTRRMRSRAGGDRKRSRPISRVLSRTIIHLGPLSPAASSDLPGSPRGDGAGPLPGRLLPYLVLLQVGFSVPRRVTTRAVRSYRTFSPLPRAVRPVAVYFLWHFPWARAPQALPGTLPAGARTFLPRVSPRAIAWPAPGRTLDASPPAGNHGRLAVAGRAAPAGRPRAAAPGEARRQRRRLAGRQFGREDAHHPLEIRAAPARASGAPATTSVNSPLSPPGSAARPARTAASVPR